MKKDRCATIPNFIYTLISFILGGLGRKTPQMQYKRLYRISFTFSIALGEIIPVSEKKYPGGDPISLWEGGIAPGIRANCSAIAGLLGNVYDRKQKDNCKTVILFIDTNNNFLKMYKEVWDYSN